jgi:CubicO group peptidase (beta-lactamase class C family)
MQFAPGTQYRYNNSAYVLLGAIIEKASGTSYAAFLEERIFKPLGMKSAAYGSNEPILPGRTEGYTLEAGAPRNARYLSMTQPYSAGALVASVDDLAAWDAALNTEKLLERAALEKMWTPYRLADGKATGYGYGWAISELRGRPSVEHGGGIFGFSTYALRVPGDRVFVAVLCNSDSPPVEPSFLAKKLAALAVGDPYPERVAVSLDPKQLERYVGVYQIAAGVTRSVSVEDGRLYTQRSGGR